MKIHSPSTTLAGKGQGSGHLMFSLLPTWTESKLFVLRSSMRCHDSPSPCNVCMSTTANSQTRGQSVRCKRLEVWWSLHMSFCHCDNISPVSRSKWLRKQLCNSSANLHMFCFFVRGRFASSAHAAGPVYRDLAFTSWISIGDWTSSFENKTTHTQAQPSPSCHSIFGHLIDHL